MKSPVGSVSLVSQCQRRLMRLLQRSALLRDLLLLLLWLLVWELARLVEYTEHASVWFPCAGLTFAALLVLGLRAVPVLMIGCVLISFWSIHSYNLPLTWSQSLEAGLLFGLAHILPYAAGAALLRLFSRQQQRNFPMLILAFLLIAALSALLASVLVLAQLVVCNMLPLADVRQTWLPFWIGDLAGVVVIAPLFFALLTLFKPGALFRLTDATGLQQLRWQKNSTIKLAINILALVLVMLLAKLTQSPNSAFAIFLLVIPQMWIACTESALFNVISVAFSSFLIALLVHLFALMDYVMVYQFAINVIAANTLFGLSLPALIEENIRLRQVAFTDGLTQAATRERLEQQAGIELLRQQRAGKPLSLVLFDIDYFKQINDEHGHQLGDQVLTMVCQIARQYLRPSDLLARYGGDEFVLLLPDTDAEVATCIAERMLQQFRQVKIADLSRVTASFGISQQLPDEDYAHLFARADQALYQAKHQGRDQVQLFTADRLLSAE